MIRIAIVEDEAECSDRLLSHIAQFSKEKQEDCVTTVFTDGVAFMEQYNGTFDLIFMDIEMPHMNGMKTAEKLRQVDDEVIIIFVTRMAQYALNGYEVGALDFMVKPVQYFNFSVKMQKVLRRLQQKDHANLLINEEAGVRKIPYAQIYYIESDLHYLRIHAQTGVHVIRDRLSEIQKRLGDLRFCACGKSYLVNLSYVEQITANTVVVNGTELPLSRSCKKSFKDAFTRYFGAQRG